MRILGPSERDEIKSTKWPSCFIATDGGNPDLLVFGTAHNLLGDFPILFRPDRARRVGEDGLFIGRALFELDAFRDKGLEELYSEDLADPLDDVAGQVGPLVVERDEDAHDLELGVGDPLDLLDRFEEVVCPLEAEGGGLDGDEDGIGGDPGGP